MKMEMCDSEFLAVSVSPRKPHVIVVVSLKQERRSEKYEGKYAQGKKENHWLSPN